MKIVWENPTTRDPELHLKLVPFENGKGFSIKESSTGYTLLSFTEQGVEVYGGFSGTYAGQVPASAIKDGYIKVNR